MAQLDYTPAPRAAWDPPCEVFVDFSPGALARVKDAAAAQALADEAYGPAERSCAAEIERLQATVATAEAFTTAATARLASLRAEIAALGEQVARMERTPLERPAELLELHNARARWLAAGDEAVRLEGLLAQARADAKAEDEALAEVLEVQRRVWCAKGERLAPALRWLAERSRRRPGVTSLGDGW